MEYHAINDREFYDMLLVMVRGRQSSLATQTDSQFFSLCAPVAPRAVSEETQA